MIGSSPQNVAVDLSLEKCTTPKIIEEDLSLFQEFIFPKRNILKRYAELTSVHVGFSVLRQLDVKLLKFKFCGQYKVWPTKSLLI